MIRFRSPLFGLKNPFGGRKGSAASFTVAFTGLTDGVAEIDTHASIGYSSDITPDSVIWSSENPAGPDKSGAATTYGTGANPTDFSDGDGESLYLHVGYDPGDGTVWVTRSAPIRQRPPVNTELPEIYIINDLPPDLLAGFGEVIGVFSAGVWNAPGAGIINGYAYDNGDGTYTVLSGTSAVEYTVGAADSGKTIVRYERRVSSGGDETVYSSGITVETFTAAASTEDPTLVFTTLNEGDVVEMRANGVTGNPTPTVTLQLMVDGLLQPGKIITGSAGNVTIPSGTDGSSLSVRKTLTSPMNVEPIVVDSITYGPVTAPVVPPLSNLSVGEQTEDGLPVNYTLTSETGVRFVFTPTGTLPAAGPFTGVAAQISGQTVSGAHGYTDATLTPLDDLSTIGNMPEGISPTSNCDVHVLVNGGGDGDVYAVAIDITLNTLTAPILTPVTGGWNVISPLLKTPVLTPVEGGWNVGD